MGVGISRGRAHLAFRRAAGVVLLAVALASCASRTTRAAGPAGGEPVGTAVRTFAAYNTAGHLVVRVTDKQPGSCFSSSAAAPVAGAYRCFAGQEILDPCFAPRGVAHPASVACVADPWSAATVLTLTKPLPADSRTGDSTRPWAVVLGNGVRCVASTGTVPAVAGVNLGYSCANGSAAAIDVSRGSRVTVAYGAPGAHALRHQAVRTLWRA